MKLKDKVAVVTGGGRGIGKAICLAFAGEGANVAVVADVKSEVGQVAGQIEKLGRKALPYSLDITRPEEVKAMADVVGNTFGKIDILVNNAGVVGKRFFLCESDDDIWRRTIEVNLFGTYYVTKTILPIIMEQKKGRVINIASTAGKQGSPTNSAYSASKHAVIGLTRTVAAELGLLGFTEITANAICPGATKTDMLFGDLDEWTRLLGTTREKILIENVFPRSIQRRLIEPEEIAGMAVYLASDVGRGITGQAINVCAGSVFY